MSLDATYLDAFNLLCGDLIGSGCHRTVYSCRIDPTLVVKVESAESRRFANVFEHAFWSDNQYNKRVAEWLAPVHSISPDGRVLLQRRADPVPLGYDLPDKLPGFLTDHKRENFGLLDGRLVSVDYAITILPPSMRPRKAWWNG